ncbi:MAG: HD domain-containing protein [Nitrospirae bacterium]|nr:HD domain-containing protein [Nitrospirota bacterium]
MLNRLGIEAKFISVVIAAVVMVISVLGLLIMRRETAHLEEDHHRNAKIVTTAIHRTIRDNMLKGRPEETQQLIATLKDVDPVRALSVLRTDGSSAFGMAASPLPVKKEELEKLAGGSELTYASGGSRYFLTPLMNEAACRNCHKDDAAVRGVVVVAVSEGDIALNIADLARRMTWFGLLAALTLSGGLVVLSRKMLLSPIRGLTAAADRISRGDFVFHRPRRIDCQKMHDCVQKDCPSYENNAIPCWLTTGTLCQNSPSGQFALKHGDCRTCRVYREHCGDELMQLTDAFNRMSVALKKHEEDTARHILETEALNHELTKSNTKLSTLLNASRLTTSTLQLEQTLSLSLSIILDITNLKVGVVLLIEEDPDARCYKYFDCSAHNCPAYGSGLNCWSLSGTMCHGGSSSCPHGLSATACWDHKQCHSHLVPLSQTEKFDACSSCAFFSSVVLIPKMVSGFRSGHLGERLKIDGSNLHKALLMGRTLVNYSKENPFDVPIETITEIAMPLKVKDQITGILYLASDKAHHYREDEIEFFQFLADIISSGIVNSRLFDDVETSYLQTVTALANAIEAKDPYTGGHSERVAALSMKVAEAMGLSTQEKEHLRFAAALHDVGKIGIGRELLRKNGCLDPDERKEISSHPERGVQILEPIHFLKPVLPAIRHHHEKYDGSGYPLGLKGREIPLKARIIGIADAWDAMMSKRPYRDPLPIQVARDELIKHAGAQFDPAIVEHFIAALQQGD